MCLLPAAGLDAQQLAMVKAGQIQAWRAAAADTVFVVNFWATWCEPCVAELPAFDRLQEEFSGKPLRIVLVDLDFKKQIDKRLLPFLEKNRPKPQVVFMDESNPNNWIDQVSPDWSGAIPATWIVGGKNRTDRLLEKKLSYTELRKAVRQAMQ